MDKSGSSNNNESVDAKWTEEFIKQAVVQFETLLSQGKQANKLGKIVTKSLSGSLCHNMKLNLNGLTDLYQKGLPSHHYIKLESFSIKDCFLDI